jgi:hypothetical protein
MRGAAVADITRRMLDRMPDYYSGDRFIEGFEDALGREIQRIWDRSAKIQADFLLQADADDTYGILSMWELLLDVPVGPPVSEAERLNNITALLRARQQSSGASWQDAVNYALQGSPWTYEEGPGAYQVTLFVSFSSSSFNSTQIEMLLRKITPAHLDVAVQYNQGFVVGEGIVGEDRL